MGRGRRVIEEGQVFGDLTILKEDKKRGTARCFRVRCVCGKEKVVRMDNLVAGDVTHCGCKKPSNKEHPWRDSLYVRSSKKHLC